MHTLDFCNDSQQYTCVQQTVLLHATLASKHLPHNASDLHGVVSWSAIGICHHGR